MNKVQITFTIPEDKEPDIRGVLRMAGAENIIIKMLAQQDPGTVKCFQEMKPPVAKPAPEVVAGYQETGGTPQKKRQQSYEVRMRTVLLAPGTTEIFKMLSTKKFGTDEELRRAFMSIKSLKNQTYAPTTYYTYIRMLEDNKYVRRTSSGAFELNKEKFEGLKKELGWS
jgi:hypothetical protein